MDGLVRSNDTANSRFSMVDRKTHQHHTSMKSLENSLLFDFKTMKILRLPFLEADFQK